MRQQTTSKPKTSRIAGHGPVTPLRQSARLLKLNAQRCAKEQSSQQHQLPSPPHSSTHAVQYPLKRRRLQSDSSLLQPQGQESSQKRPRLQQSIDEVGHQERDHPISYWAETGYWPRAFADRANAMSEVPSAKRKSPSTHRSVRLDRLSKHGVFMKSSSQVQKASRDLGHRLMTGDRTPSNYCNFPQDKVSTVLERVQPLNESRIQRDITPLIVPSAELLFFCDELSVDFIGDEINAEWIRCATLGGSIPKPDYTAGIVPGAFTLQEQTQLKCYASPTRPFFFTPELTFPFLICETKTGERGMNEADRQNVHSASIAVKAIIELYKEAFGTTDPARVEDLYGKILVYTVSHDNDRASLFGHFAVSSDHSDRDLEFYRYQFALTSLTLDDGRDRYRIYNFVRNVYEQFALDHFQRIRDAARALRKPSEQAVTSFGASALALEEQDSQQSSQDTTPIADEAFQRPRVPASSLRIEEASVLRQQVDSQREQIDRLMQQLEAQRKDGQQQVQQQREQMEKQMQQQREQMEKQMLQQKEIIALLKQRS